MKMTKEQAIQAIMQQAINIEKITGCTGKQAIEKATIQVDKLIRSLSNGQLNLKKVMCL